MKLRLSGATMNAVADKMGVNRRTVYLYLRGYVPMSDSFREKLNKFLMSSKVAHLTPTSTTDEANFRVAEAVMRII
jgi:predicted transcriptional regulator